MCKEQTFRSEVYAKDNGFVVERYHPNGKLVDRYFTTDLTQPRKNKDWSAGVAAIASQPSACLPVEQTLSAKLAKLDAYLEKELQQAMQEAHDVEFHIIIDDASFEHERAYDMACSELLKNGSFDFSEPSHLADSLEG